MLFDAKEALKAPQMKTIVEGGQTYLVYSTNYFPAWGRFGHAISWAYVAGLEAWEGV